MNVNVDLNWLCKQIQIRSGLSKSELGESICAAMVAGRLTGFAQKALRYPMLTVRSCFMAGDGAWKDFVIPSNFWEFIEVDWDEPTPVFHFHLDQNNWIIYKIEVNRESAYSYIRSQDPVLRASDPNEAKSLTLPTTTKSKGGRPPKYDWDACRIEAVRWMTHRGRPNTQAELFAHMAEWFGPDGPGDTQLKQHLRLVYRAFRPTNQAD
ncbi:hypothetical protein [Methylobacterium sp. NEAU K]|uniref:hypothetical protein n=1 Tax=Methylobacterium sp. NEAU K TaxID=3064946 RepID=UPI00273259ED|nr:hypothetical protein [Methylobacterium sp. NEAU K]MDP4006685.1 hypothetical protein [Methylobacterium sp. NEAU K]